MALIFALSGHNWSVSSVVQSCLTLCNPMNCSTQDFFVHNQLPELTQTHVHRVGDAIQPSHPLSSPSAPDFNPSQKNWYIHSNNWYIHLNFQIIVNEKYSNSLNLFSYKKNLIMAQEMHKQSSNMKAQNSEHFLVMTNILLLQKE